MRRIPASCMSSLTGPTWWIEQLSIIRIDLLLEPLNGCISGINVPRMKSMNLSELTELTSNSTACKPSEEIAVIAEIRFPRARDQV